MSRAALRVALLVPLAASLAGCAVVRGFLGAHGPLVAGQRVRVDLPDSQPPHRTGRLVAVTDDSVVLGRDSTTVPAASDGLTGRLALGLEDVDGFDISRGLHRDPLGGALIGAVAGSLVGFAVLCTRIQDCLGHADAPLSQAATIALVSVGSGVLIGGTVGFFVRSEQWELVPPGDLRGVHVPPSPGPAQRLEVGFSLFPAFRRAGR